ncbi:HU family DNA-binding protein [Roseibacterium beibuensis]|uniref:DNA-binding protein n=1 Tax=[Roseibacterium] beibuensis TaxID=1193142 RepID=A0ABP9LRY5_9RHOB|nr:HU family DNA-binding protein [Roseibacterium beibuensis]MCS6626730.1 HU family DNA-binding protein [Roseibacterium beibuensis]
MTTKSTTSSRKRKSTPAGRSRSRTTTAKAATPTSSDKSTKEKKTSPTPRTAPAPAPLRAVESATKNTAAPETPAQGDNDSADRAKRPDLLDAIASRSALKRSEVKLVMDLMLDEMGKLLDTHEEVAVPPLGKLMVKKRMEKPGGHMLTLKLKRATGGADGASGTTVDKPAKDSD